MSPTFSIIIPLYNKAPYVRKAMESVVGQTYENWELIVVDDESTDGSGVIAKDVISDNRIHLFRQNNTGVSIARNNGVAASKGDYLCFLDADDWWEPTFLEEIERLIGDFPNAGIYGTNYTIANETKHKTRVAKIGIEENFEKGYINYCQSYSKTMYMPLWTGAVCMPRTIFNEMGGFPEGIKLGEDFILWVHVALKHNVVLLNKPLSNYNQDVDVTYRGTHHLRDPKEHMLWNLGDLEPFEKTNPDYKQLIDNLRTYGLMPYLINSRYSDAAQQELAKVDWRRQPAATRRLYHQPIWCLRLRACFLKTGSKIKQTILRHV